MIYVWALEHMSDEDAQEWARKLDDPLPGEAGSLDMEADEIDQLKNL